MAIILVLIGTYFVKVGDADQKMQQALHSMPGMLSGPTSNLPHFSLFSLFPLDWGALIILLGSVMMLTAAAMHES